MSNKSIDRRAARGPVVPNRPAGQTDEPSDEEIIGYMLGMPGADLAHVLAIRKMYPDLDWKEVEKVIDRVEMDEIVAEMEKQRPPRWRSQ